MASKTVDNGTLTDYDVATGTGAVDGDTQRVTLASDDPAVALLGTIDADTGSIAASLTLSGTPAVTTVSDTATSATLLSSSGTRKGFRITNTSSAVLFVKYGATAPHRIVGYYTHGTTEYVFTGGLMLVTFGSTSLGEFDATGNQDIITPLVPAIKIVASEQVNAALLLYVPDAITDGDGDLTIHVWYSIEDVPA